MKKAIIFLMITVLVTASLSCMFAATAAEAPAEQAQAVPAEEKTNDVTGTKAVAAAIVVGVAAAAGAVSMTVAIAGSTGAMARQPEAAGKINSAMMLGLVFIETAIIYALIVAVLIIFVL
ncbi:MAG: ATP synthase F0 subunit C [Clostridia bacterium]|nr:ATP synthase F0 subunit C [Clostridia bacterium]